MPGILKELSQQTLNGDIFGPARHFLYPSFVPVSRHFLRENICCQMTSVGLAMKIEE